MNRDTPDSDNDITCAKLKADERWKSSVKGSRPVSIASEPEKRWIDIVTGKKSFVKQKVSSNNNINQNKK